MFLIGGQTCCTAQIHLLSAIGTVDHTRKWIDFLMFGGTALVLAKLLHQIKLLLSYDRLMSILKDEPFFLRISHGLLVFVGLLVCSEVDRMTDVFRTVKNISTDGISAVIILLIFASMIRSGSISTSRLICLK